MPGGIRRFLCPDDPALRLSPRVLVVVAHPDDEVVGAGALISRLPDVWILHATDGAPRDPRFMARGFAGTREEYARTRRRELEEALSLAGIGPDRLLGLGIADQEAVFEIPRLTERIARAVRELGPELLLTLAYEGGHPDHDAVALAVQQAARGVEVLEMPLYHAEPGAERMAVAEFLPGPPETRLTLTDGERSLKQSMIEAFSTQKETLRAFLPPRDERFRPASSHDFTRPPHEGRLQYEIWGFPIDGKRWREAAKSHRSLAPSLHVSSHDVGP
ncbi:MAG TPA: PIG-L family deacetylase [Thermoanaerobaculia bacterium]|nr:PIG-L family deacetylase [Thermoanaerobaculia bacterium]